MDNEVRQFVDATKLFRLIKKEIIESYGKLS